MRLRTGFLALTAALAAARVPAQSVTDQAGKDIRYLASDALQGRGLGTPGLDSAAAYVAAAFRKIGLTPGGDGSFFQPFTVDSSAPAAAHNPGIAGARAKNVVALLPGTGTLADQAIVIGAHYDHLGLGGMEAMDNPDSTGKIHNGADDNASGTVALMEIARRLEQERAPNRRTFVFIAFSGEEMGLLGSTYYVKHPVRPLATTYAMLNLDMVGRLGDRKLTVFGTQTAREFPTLLDSVATQDGLPVSGSGDGYGSSDHESFYTQNIPVLHFFSGMHEDYHRTTDDWQKIDLNGLVRIAGVATDMAERLATRTAPLTYVKIEARRPVGGGGYGAYLGSIPDMSESPGGVRLSGVRAGSPAEEAGLKGGDILIQLGDHVIKNLYDMQDALNACKPGDTVVLVYLRDGKQIATKATLRKRGG